MADEQVLRRFASLEVGIDRGPLARVRPSGRLDAAAADPGTDALAVLRAALAPEPPAASHAAEPPAASHEDEPAAEAGAGSGTATADAPAPPVVPAAAPPAPNGWTDPLTGSDGPRMWDRILVSEQARNDRHGRTATIALCEVTGYDAAVGSWGRDLATHLFVRLARVLTSGIRTSDHIARIAPTRFGVLLTETDEILAINFVDRVRSLCRAEVDPASHMLRIVIGWASPPAGGRLEDASVLAEERLAEALRRDA